VPVGPHVRNASKNTRSRRHSSAASGPSQPNAFQNIPDRAERGYISLPGKARAVSKLNAFQTVQRERGEAARCAHAGASAFRTTFDRAASRWARELQPWTAGCARPSGPPPLGRRPTPPGDLTTSATKEGEASSGIHCPLDRPAPRTDPRARRDLPGRDHARATAPLPARSRTRELPMSRCISVDLIDRTRAQPRRAALVKRPLSRRVSVDLLDSTRSQQQLFPRGTRSWGGRYRAAYLSTCSTARARAVPLPGASS
jgi:hypothetical protein